MLRKFKKKLMSAYYTWRIKKTVGSYSGSLQVNGKTILTPKTFLGKNTHFNGLVIRGKGKVTIGDNFHSAGECILLTSTHTYTGEALPYDHTYIHQDITIKDNVWLGYRAMVLPGVTIGEGAIIQAGSVVVKDIPPLAIAGGHPAIPFKYRDKDHYEKLKQEGKFH